MEEQSPYGPKWTLAKYISQKGFKHAQVCRQMQIARMTYDKKIANVNLLSIEEVMRLAKHFEMDFVDLAAKLYQEVRKKN